MKYYLIVGEASGDLHAAHLMASLKKNDHEASFRFFGGDLMSAVGGTRVKHYRELAYMGFVPVLLHLRTIFRNMSFCKKDIVAWQPDVVILVDYPGFNLDIAKYLKQHTHIPVYYYISPKIWAWKEWRIKAIRRDVKDMFSILPFETAFYEGKHHYKIHYVGNPTAHEIHEFLTTYHTDFDGFRLKHHIADNRPMIALLPGSRKQEIKDNLVPMLRAVQHFSDRYQIAIGAAPAIEPSYYQEVIGNATDVTGLAFNLIHNDTYGLLYHAVAALVTSGTATLETALLHVPQVVCYKTPVPRLIRWAFNHILSCRYISLVNLIVDREVVPELFADRFNVSNIVAELGRILPEGEGRAPMLQAYKEVEKRLGDEVAPDNAARLMVGMLRQEDCCNE